MELTSILCGFVIDGALKEVEAALAPLGCSWRVGSTPHSAAHMGTQESTRFSTDLPYHSGSSGAYRMAMVQSAYTTPRRGTSL